MAVQGSNTKTSIGQTLANSIAYTYQPLEYKHHVRLLRLHQVQEQIECSLKEIPLADTESDSKFEALSYAWGSEEKPFHAVIHDTRGPSLGYIPLTRNLHDALRDLRDTPKLNGKSFWIDQICINQDDEEKTHQVNIMDRIYKSAARVIMYIGSAQSLELEERGVQLLHDVDKHFAIDYQFISERGNIWNALVGRNDCPIIKLSDDIERNYTANDWKWLADLASGPWYDRLWMIQEQLANANVVMLRGPRLVAWEKVAAMTILFGMHLLPQQHWPPSTRLTILEFTVFSLWRDRRDRCFEASSRTLLENIKSYPSLKCRDPRDRIYSLLGLSSDGEKLSIYPDYSAANTVERLFLYNTIRMLEEAADLSVLTQVVKYQHQQGFPSWALNPSSSFRLIAVPNGFSPHGRSSLASRPKFRANNMVLALRGSRVDEIQLSTPKIVSPRGHYPGLMNDLWIQPVTQYLSALATVISSVGVTLRHAAALGRAMRMVLSGIVPDAEQPVTVEYAAGCTCFEIRRWAHELSTYDHQPSPDTTKVLAACESIVHSLYRAMQSPYAQQDDSVQVNLALRETELCFQLLVTRDVVFCVSEKGRIGIVQDGTIAGDVVVGFEGADRLFTLRSEGSRYRLIGGAYFDGLMDGEFYADVDPNEIDEVIELT